MAGDEPPATQQPPLDELARVRQTYAARHSRLAGGDKYSLSNDAYLFTIQQRQRAVLKRLRREGILPLEGKRILELGCGEGGVLLELLSLGADPQGLHGTDLLLERVSVAHERLPQVAINCADGQRLPYADNAFDLVLQFTVFSSILADPICYTVAQEMVRVVRPEGTILWYDFWTNPVNRQTRGIRRHQLHSLFPTCEITVDRITLAPPLTRRIVPISWTGALLLEKLRFLNTHYLVTISPSGKTDHWQK